MNNNNDDEAPGPCPHPEHRISVPVNGRYTCMQCGRDVPRPRRPAAHAREAWKDWTPADAAKKVEPWPRPSAAEGADHDCFAPAAPTALLLIAERQPDSTIAAAIARGHSRPHVIAFEPRPPRVELSIDVPSIVQRVDAQLRAENPNHPHPEEFKIGPPQPLVPYQRVNCTPKTEPQLPPARIDGAINWCGLCGQAFRIAPDDPHWSTGRGPICPAPKPKP